MHPQDDRRIFLAEQSDLSDRIQTRLRHKGDDMESPPKLCKDCAHSFLEPCGVYLKCARIDKRLDLVTGETHFAFCETGRFGFRCGVAALLFQPKAVATSQDEGSKNWVTGDDLR